MSLSGKSFSCESCLSNGLRYECQLAMRALIPRDDLLSLVCPLAFLRSACRQRWCDTHDSCERKVERDTQATRSMITSAEICTAAFVRDDVGR